LNHHKETRFPIKLSGPSHLIAVRYSNFLEKTFAKLDYSIGFQVAIADGTQDVDWFTATERRDGGIRLFSLGLLLAFSVLHGLIYIYYRKARENLYYAAFTGSFGLLAWILYLANNSVGPAENLFRLIRLIYIVVLMVDISSLRFCYSLVQEKAPRSFWAFCFGASVLALGLPFFSISTVYLFTLVVLAEVLRINIWATAKHPRDMWTVGAGTAIFVAGTTLTLLQSFGLIGTGQLLKHSLLFGSFGLLLGYSLHLARSLSHVHTQLEQANLGLEHYSRTLEDRVQVRTEEISDKNAELERTLSQLQKAQSQLVMQEKMASLGNLVAGVAHEVNNPVGAVRSASDVIRRCVQKVEDILLSLPMDQERLQELTRTLGLMKDNNAVALSGSERIATIVRSLRTFARLDEALFQEVDLHEGIDSTLTLLQHEIRDRIDIVRDYGNIPRVNCYPNELNQVFMNLLVNAIQAITGPGVITICTRTPENGVRISITDTGKGIEQENLSRLFDPGFTTKGVGVGTGLGLSISYQIVEKHRGAIHVESEPGQGSTFTVTLPTNLENASDQPSSTMA